MKKYLDLIKENFNLIVAIPPILGALWQITELSRLSLSYIRFFSISQLVADGVLILILLLVFSLGVFILYKKDVTIYNEDKIEERKINIFEDLTTVKKPSILWGSCYYILSFMFIIIWLKIINNWFVENIKEPYIIAILFPFNLIIFLIILTLIVRSLEHFKKSVKKRIAEFLYLFMIFLITIVPFIIFKSYYLEFNKLMLLPNNLENIKKVENEIKNNHKNTTIKLKYLNDKYIFYSITDKKGNEKIKIIKFDNLFIE